jgi:large subunit ribosomal protein L11
VAPLLFKAANLKGGSGEPNRNKVGSVTMAQVEEIARIKLPDLNCTSLESAVAQVVGTARSAGITVVA